MKVFEKYQKLFNACRKYPEVNLSKRCGTKLPENASYSVQSGIDTNDEIIPEKSVKNDYLIILFVDGSLYPEYIKRIEKSGEYYCSDSKNFVTIDAKDGVRSNKNSLDHLKKISEMDNEPYVVYTNSIIALNNEYSWNETMQRPEIYLNYNTYKSFTKTIEFFQNITSLTSKALRKEHNIAKMYLAGAFK